MSGWFRVLSGHEGKVSRLKLEVKRLRTESKCIVRETKLIERTHRFKDAAMAHNNERSIMNFMNSFSVLTTTLISNTSARRNNQRDVF